MIDFSFTPEESKKMLGIFKNAKSFSISKILGRPAFLFSFGFKENNTNNILVIFKDGKLELKKNHEIKDLDKNMILNRILWQNIAYSI